MSALTERGASSSSMNLINSSTRLPEGVATQNPRTGSVLSAALSAAARLKVPMSSRPIQLFTKFSFEVMFDISTVRSPSVEPHFDGGEGKLVQPKCRLFSHLLSSIFPSLIVRLTGKYTSYNRLKRTYETFERHTNADSRRGGAIVRRRGYRTRLHS